MYVQGQHQVGNSCRIIATGRDVRWFLQCNSPSFNFYYFTSLYFQTQNVTQRETFYLFPFFIRQICFHQSLTLWKGLMTQWIYLIKSREIILYQPLWSNRLLSIPQLHSLWLNKCFSILTTHWKHLGTFKKYQCVWMWWFMPLIPAF